MSSDSVDAVAAQKILRVFLNSPFHPKYAKQIEDELKQPNPVSHERTLTYLKTLTAQRILFEEKKGRQNFYQLNPNHSASCTFMALAEQARAQNALKKMNIATLAHEITDKVQRALGFNLLFVVLFGSYARQNERTTSDLDLLFVVNRAGPYRKRVDALVEKTASLYTQKISVHIVGMNELEKRWHKEPVYSSIFRDRVVLFGAEAFWRFVLKEGAP